MKKLTKTQKKIYTIFDRTKTYSLTEASKIVKEISSYTHFNSSIDISISLARKANQIIRGIVKLPFGSGKYYRVLALVESDKQIEAKEAGADFIGSEEFFSKINDGWTEIDVIITTPTMMPKLGRLGKILGPKKLMPSTKSGTITTDIGKAIKEVKLGKIDFRADCYGIVHVTIGKSSFEAFQIKENSIELVNTLHHIKPSSTKGTYIKSIFLSGTMTPGVRVDVNSISYYI